MQIISNYSTPNFQARLKLKTPNMGKFKQVSTNSARLKALGNKDTLLNPNNRQYLILPFLASAFSAFYSGMAPAENVEPLLSGAEITDNVRETGLLAGLTSLLTPLSAFATSELLASSNVSGIESNFLSNKSDDKKLPS